MAARVGANFIFVTGSINMKKQQINPKNYTFKQ